MNIVDSSAWLEYFGKTPRAKHFEKTIENIEKLMVPVIILYEVFKILAKETDVPRALQAIAQIKQGLVIPINTSLALAAATISKENDLPMADSFILATAQEFNATLWTQDADFKKFPGVKYFPKT